MLGLIRNNNPFTIFVLFIFTVTVKIRILLSPQLPVFIEHHFIYNFIISNLSLVFGRLPMVFCLASIISLFFQSIYIKSISSRHKIFSTDTFIPSYLYILFSSLSPSLSQFGEPMMVNWLILCALDIIFSFSHTNQPRKIIFNASFLIGAAALFQFTFLSFFILLFLGIVMLRSFNAGEWSVALMGFCTPFYFLSALLFIFDKQKLLSHWLHINFPPPQFQNYSKYTSVVVIVLSVLLVAGTFVLQSNISVQTIYIRRNWLVVGFYFLTSLFVIFFTGNDIESVWLLAMPSLSIITANGFLYEKRKLFSNFTFYLSILLLIFCLWAFK